MIHFLRADFGHSCNFLQYFKKDKTKHFLFLVERSFIIAKHLTYIIEFPRWLRLKLDRDSAFLSDNRNVYSA